MPDPGPAPERAAAADRLAEELEAAHAAASELTGPGERVAAVMASEPGAGVRVYLVAYESAEGISYVALDAALRPLSDPRVVREAVTVLALAERAEEASAATVADELVDALEQARAELDAAGLDEASTSAREAGDAAAAVGEAASGPRVASPVYLDEMAAAAAALDTPLFAFRTHAEGISHRLSAEPGDALERAARAAWAVLATVGRAGDPADFTRAMTSSTGAVEALVADVLRHYRADLEGP
jgi:hypothetical protein